MTLLDLSSFDLMMVVVMLFLHPMWSHETQRIGKRKCTPTGYLLHVWAELIGILGLFLLLALPVVLLGKWIEGSFSSSLWWLIAVPFVFGVISELMFQFSWWLAYRKGFQYDDERGEASWMERGERRTYKHAESS